MIVDNEIIIAFIAIIFITIGLLYLEKGNRLKKKGKRTKAIILTNKYKVSGNDMHGVYHPVVRFATEDNEWITLELDFGQNPAMPEGKEIEILYNPLKPEEVIINSSLQLVYIPWIFISLGSCGLILSCLELLDITNFI